MIEIFNILPKELEAILASLDYEEDGGILINQVIFLKDDLQVVFTLSFGSNDIPKQFWQLDVKNIQAEKIVIGWERYFEFYSDHYLLYEFIDPYMELYFNGKADNSEKLFINLYKSYLGTYSKNLDFGYGINAPDGLLNLCAQGNGLFARGPKRILEKYEKCLKAHGVRTNYIGQKEPENKDLKLLIIGDSHFVGQSFEFQRIKNYR